MLIIKQLGLQAYTTTLKSMQYFTETRDEHTYDECWLLEHHPVYTTGKTNSDEHILQQTNIPIIHSDRGGKITYHAPGQLTAYFLIDLKRKKITPHKLVNQLESTVIRFLAQHKVTATASREARGVYINGKKISSIGLRIRKGCSYHGIALNINMDLTPFKMINPCGYANLSMTQLSDYKSGATVENSIAEFIDCLKAELNYTQVHLQKELAA